MLKRLFDIVFSLVFLILLLPLFLFISILIIMESKGSAIFRQIRVGKNGKHFTLYKFRSMYQFNNHHAPLLTTANDNRITRIGKFLRKTKLDELPQLINILKGDMSFVGPRPEVPKYVALYNDEQRQILTVRPGLTDYASLHYINESEELAKHSNPEEYYIHHVLPKKIALSLQYIRNQSFFTDICIIVQTLLKILYLKK
ncbi:MAG: sugar transferase [Bacteroidales bacterium]|nr:sugar transferase [Bacteroidales bacterium]